MAIRRLARPLLGGLLLATLAACSGSGQKQGRLNLPGTPTAAAPIAEGSAASGSTGTTASVATASAAPASTATIAGQIAALERGGAYPTLDRSTDIVGPDANKNGVRDDIEAWINSQPVNDAQRKAVMQKARALQGTLTVSLKDQSALQAGDDRLAASSNVG
jgi:hypothetical protein